MKKHKPTIPIAFALLFILIGISAAAYAWGDAVLSLNEEEAQDAWEVSRQEVAQIEAQKFAGSVIADEEEALTDYVSPIEKQAAVLRYREIQASLSEMQSNSRRLTEEEQSELIALQDEALDLDLRYELSRTVSEAEKLQSTINTLASEADGLPYFYEEPDSATSASQAQSIRYQIFLAEAYAELAIDVQAQWDSGADVDCLQDYIADRREQILSDAADILFGADGAKSVN